MALMAGQGAASTLVPPGVAALVDSATRAVLITKTKITTALLLAATIAVVGGGLLIPQPGGTGTPAGQQARNPDPRPGNQDDLVTLSGRVLDSDGKHSRAPS